MTKSPLNDIIIIIFCFISIIFYTVNIWSRCGAEKSACRNLALQNFRTRSLIIWHLELVSYRDY